MNKREDFYSDVIIGMSDGLIVPFALVAGLSTIVTSSSIIVIAGLTAIVAGAIAMSVGGYRATKSESVYLHPDDEAEHKEILKEKEFLANIGLSEEMQQMALNEMKKDKEQWAGVVTKYEEDNSSSADKRAIRSAVNIGFSYAIGGLVPVIPYFFTVAPTEALKVTTAITLLCLFLFGYLKHKSLGNHPVWGAVRVLLAGAFAAGAALGVALLIK
jgi:vacuolar iron transporter family protein